jgi:hypothetical protein
MKRILKAVAVSLLICILFGFASCGGAELPPEDNRTVGLVNGKHEITYDLYKYFYLNYASAYSEADFAGDKRLETEAEIRKLCENALKNVFAVVDLAAEYGITVNDKSVKEAANLVVDEAIDEFGGKAQYAKALDSYHMTDSVFRFMMAIDACENELYATLTTGLGIIDNSDETVMAAIKGDEFIRIVQVLIAHNNGFSDEKNKETAKKVFDLAAKGEDFDRLIANYSNDYSMTRDGYYFTYGYMLDEIEEAAFDLKINEVSQIIETENGYHIIKRLEKDDSFLATNYASLKAQYESCKFYALIDERAASLTVTVNEIADEIGYNLLVAE